MLGGGIYCYYRSNLILKNVVIDSNSAGDGGGMYCDYSDPVLRNVKITHNVVTASMIGGGTGAGIYCDGHEGPANPVLSHVEICHNTADNAGGGILCRFTSAPIIDSCTISNNTGEGVFSCLASSPVIHHCNIFHCGCG